MCRRPIQRVVNTAYLNKSADDMGEVKIYRASAGSGKTHRLTQEYLKLLVGDERAYRRILAVTFTNKATEEMKSRVIEHLFKESSNKNEAEAESAFRLLKNILHDYSSFNISTIDRFFQQALRAFAKEIGKNTSYGVELNEDDILAQAVDKILFNLSTEDNERLLRWIMELSIQRIDSGKSWDVKSSIMGTANQLFKEAYKIAVKGEDNSFLNKDYIEEYSLTIQKVKVCYEKGIVELGKKGVEILKKADLSPDDFSGILKSFAQRFRRLVMGDFSPSNATFIKASESSDKWFSKDAVKANPELITKGRVAESLFLDVLLRDIIKYEEANLKDYATADVISKNLYALGMMSDIQQSIKEVSEENGVVLLSETTELLNDIIDGSDTPFIFEKIGARTDHFMLDEFQDTSLMQWENFRPLLMNSLSSGYSNLIVGDEKQSIYRWRGSDWMLLNKTIFSDFREDEINYSSLSENWRSGKEVIDFINDFFPNAALACDKILGIDTPSDTSATSIYSSVKQTIPISKASKKGFVEVKISTSDGEELTDAPLVYVREKIEMLLKGGAKLKDIAVLVRKNTEGASIAEFLIDSGIKVISGDSLFLNSSTSVSSIIAQLKYFSNPQDDLNNILARFSGLNLESNKEVSTLPLYEMCESLADALPEEIKIAESAYIIAFLDKVKEYIKLYRADLSAFIQWWNDNSKSLAIPAPDGEDAVRVMTIHKSKGLGFPTVIVPFTDFGFKGMSDIIWCKPKTAPFNRMPVVPINKAEILLATHFGEDLLRENFLRVIDNLNLAYVAFTRAKDNLFIFIDSPVKPVKEAKGVGDILNEIYKDKVNSDGVYSYGDSAVINASEELPFAEKKMPLFTSYDNSDNLRLTLRSEEFFNDEESSRARGVVIHSIMSRIRTIEDIDSAVKAAISSGELESNDEEQTIDYFNDLLMSVDKYGWFSKDIKVMNELEIILQGGIIYRPDRVVEGNEISVIDFKTGKLKSKSHEKQIMRYVTSIREMGYENVGGYLWYLDEKLVEKVI